MNIPNMLDAKRRSNKEVCITNYKFNDDYTNIGNNRTFYIKTYGCQMNEHDSEKLKGILSSAGFIESSSAYNSDIVILNTCAIRENAHNKVFGFLGRMKHLKETNKNLIVGICGCMAQEETIVNEIMNKYKWLDIVFGTHNIDKLLDYIVSINNKTIIESMSIEGYICENIPCIRSNNISAYVDIIYGCDKFCTYCIVPYTRGKQRSRRKEDIINEVIDLKKCGYKEVTLLGQNVNAYGKDLYDDYDLSDLLKDVGDTKICRIKFLTSHPWDFTDRMINTISKIPNIVPYIHLPVQSGSDKILKRMGRRYTKKSYLELYSKLKASVQGVSITTDIIVGFPGETEEDFNDTLKLVDEAKFSCAYTFAYSKREATPAYSMENQVPEDLKSKRLYILNEKINNLSLLENKKLIGTTIKCLVMSTSIKNNNNVVGYTDTNKLVNIVGDASLIGKIIPVKITDAKSFSLDGEAQK
ncbi:MAG: tRNA (N6-isopentenyl adenosine(37)-C2)-methylthiotransferase MiaB [Bacilli bacterium]